MLIPRTIWSKPLTSVCPWRSMLVINSNSTVSYSRWIMTWYQKSNGITPIHRSSAQMISKMISLKFLGNRIHAVYTWIMCNETWLENMCASEKAKMRPNLNWILMWNVCMSQSRTWLFVSIFSIFVFKAVCSTPVITDVIIYEFRSFIQWQISDFGGLDVTGFHLNWRKDSSPATDFHTYSGWW